MALQATRNPVGTTSMRRPARSMAVRAAAAHEGTKQKTYFVAMNVFKVKPESASDFEDVWRSRESHLKEMPGFVRFAMLKCENVAGKYISQTYWDSKASFDNWSQSSQFKASHGSSDSSGSANKRPNVMSMLEAPPAPEFFSSVTTTE